MDMGGDRGERSENVTFILALLGVEHSGPLHT